MSSISQSAVPLRSPDGLLLPPKEDLASFDLLDANGRLREKPQAITCHQCADRTGNDGSLLCVRIGQFLCYYHSKGKFKDNSPRGRWLLVHVGNEGKATVICDFGHRCEIPL